MYYIYQNLDQYLYIYDSFYHIYNLNVVIINKPWMKYLHNQCNSIIIKTHRFNIYYLCIYISIFIFYNIPINIFII